MAIQLDEHGYAIPHVVKTTAQARNDLVKAAAQLKAIGRHERAAQLEKLAKESEIYVPEQDQEPIAEDRKPDVSQDNQQDWEHGDAPKHRTEGQELREGNNEPRSRKDE